MSEQKGFPHDTTPINISMTNVNNQPEKKKVRHLLHLILTLLTGGLWGIVWLVLVIKS